VGTHGLFIFALQYSGAGNFTVRVKNSHGNDVSSLTNGICPYTGKKSVTLKEGKYYLEVTASGPWSVAISQ